MGLRELGACLVIAAVSLGSPAASGSREIVPRFSLSTATATSGDDIEVRVERAARFPQRAIHLYLVASDFARTMRTRFDPRLSFIGSASATRHALLVFTVPPLEPGDYSLAYWCHGCLPRGKGLGVEASPTLRITAPVGEACPTTKPNRNVPPGAPTSWSIFQWHGTAPSGWFCGLTEQS